MKKLPSSITSLILVNLIPLLGVLFLHWNLFTIMFLYWFENAIIGFYTVLKILKITSFVPEGETAAKEAARSKNFPIIPFFMFHYGVFMLAHLMFVLALFGPVHFSPYLYLAAMFLFISHHLSYKSNFIGKEEYKRTPAAVQMARPYGRIIVMHVTLIFGGIVARMLGAPTAALLLMVILKISLDLVSHMHEHKITVTLPGVKLTCH